MTQDPKKKDSTLSNDEVFEKPEISIIEIDIEEVVYAWDTT
jgi:hypothetical protein